MDTADVATLGKAFRQAGAGHRFCRPVPYQVTMRLGADVLPGSRRRLG